MIALLLIGCALLAPPQPVSVLIAGDSVCQRHDYVRTLSSCADLQLCTRLTDGGAVAWLRSSDNRFPVTPCSARDASCLQAARVAAERWACPATTSPGETR